MNSRHPSPRRWVLVTGAAGGIGRAVVRALDNKGFNVIAGVRRESDAAALKSELSSRIQTLVLELRDDEADIERAVARIQGMVGDDGLFGLVNNAGVAIPGAFEFQPTSAIRQQVDTNVLGTLYLTQRLIPTLRQACGRIIVVTSVAGRLGMPFNAVHCGTKHFLEGAFDAIRVELQPTGVSVVIVEPGTTRTPMFKKFSRSTASALSAIPREGRQYYEDSLKALECSLGKRVGAGDPPERVAGVVLAALTTPNPKARYAVGREAQIMIRLSRVLPDRLKDALITRAFRLPMKIRAGTDRRRDVVPAGG